MNVTAHDAPRPPLVRSNKDRLLAGVCGGLAQHLRMPASWVRVGMVAAVFLGGAGAVLYAFLFLTMPEADESPEVVPMRRFFTPPLAGGDPAPAASKRKRNGAWPVAEILFGACFVFAGAALVAAQMGVELRLEVILPGLAVLVGVGLTWWLIADRGQPERHQLPRILGALALVAVGVLLFFVTSREPSVLTVIGAALAVLAGVALAIAPWLLNVNRQLVAERAARAREQERAEIAAHLHDSVLQSLALIQQRSGPGDEVSRIARAQERELREWLFRTADGAAPPPRDTAVAELTEHAAALEAVHAVRFEIVAVGERVVAPDAAVAAAKEAMLNAARHAGGDVTVYIEMTPEEVSIDVSDRGPGFDLDGIEPERLGVRESILGRMERAAGYAHIAPGPGGKGASVRIRQRRQQEPRASEGEDLP